ncbi:hypothetical protein CsSME_00009689 [Camellia sinensis var. sinensis]|uniref:Plant basic secretory protein (BSP) family protein n=1 Tax=Camellia sinensis var. sinensis TaxID=542762 RepID=A0A4S4ESI3_CAMSN|nr:uncharacterized protein LOC114261101 [Camellia sinensis]THG19810.1 hypothetical protein TEA_018564 [Camellia sinensis var. sinensis]
MAYDPSLLQSFLLTLAALQSIAAVQFSVTNIAGTSPGGLRFTKEIGIDYAKQTMETTTNFIWRMLEEDNPSDRKQDVKEVIMTIQDFKGAEAITYGNRINVSAIYLEGYQGNVTWEFTSLIYHEMTHVWQWTGAGQAPIGLIEGIADYTILKANYYPKGFAKPGMGDRWDQGYDFTARFLEYCEGIKSGFVAALNKKMKNAFSVNYFVELLGKSVDELFKEYKAKYNGTVVERNGNEHENVSRMTEYKDRHGSKSRISLS